MTQLRVALVSEHASPLAALGGVDAGGQNVHVAALARELTRLGCQVVVHTRRDDVDLPDQVLTPDGYIVDHVRAGPPEAIPKDAIFGHLDELADGLAERWLAESPDLVHAHFWMSGVASRTAVAALGIPVVQTFHALGAVKRRYQGSADSSPPERLQLEWWLASGADAVIATCHDEVNELVALGASPERLHIVPCGVDTSIFTTKGPTALRRLGQYRLVAVSRLVPRKGLEDVLRAMPDIPRAELVVVGGPGAERLGDDEEAVRLQAVAAAIGVDDRVRLTGGLSRQDVAAMLRSADVAVCAPWYEPFGIVPVEAMACGTPVVGTAVGGLLDTIDDGVTGALVPPRQPAALAAAINALLADGVRRRKLGRVAAIRAARLYEWRRVAIKTLEIYRDVAGNALRSRQSMETMETA
jgi:glycosyltransferase involved in cell wall biosynthesis